MHPFTQAIRSLLPQARFPDGDEPATGAEITVVNPADGATLAYVRRQSASDAESAIRTALAAWADWRDRPAKERSGLLRRWFDLVLEHETELATIITSEQGKPLSEARGEIRYAAGFIEWFS